MQQLPQNTEAETNVLGSIIKNNDCLVDIVGLLNAEDFYSSAHKIIYNSILEMFKANVPIDITTLVNKLGKENLVSVGGITYIAEITNSIPSTANVKNYVNIVKEKADRRKIIKACDKALNTAYDEGEKPSNVISLLESNLLNIGQTNENTIHTETEVLEETLSMIQDNYERGGDITGVGTGFKQLDKAINGLNKGDFIVIAARPSMGKTVFALNLGKEVAKESIVLNFSLEMSNKKLILRKLAGETRINSNKIRMGNLDDKQWEILTRKASILAEKSKMLYDDTPGLTLQEIKARCKKTKLKYGLDVVIIDHIGLIVSTMKTDDKRKQIEDITNNLKRIAKELDICVIGLSQLSRAPDMRAEHRPQLSDLRESGSIEQDTDTVIGLYRDEYYNPQSEEAGVLETIILKNRDGQLGTIKLSYNAEYQYISEIPIRR